MILNSGLVCSQDSSFEVKAGRSGGGGGGRDEEGEGGGRDDDKVEAAEEGTGLRRVKRRISRMFGSILNLSLSLSLSLCCKTKAIGVNFKVNLMLRSLPLMAIQLLSHIELRSDYFYAATNL